MCNLTFIYLGRGNFGCIQPFPKQALVFKCLQNEAFEIAVAKGEIARNKQFLLFPQCFLPVLRTFCHVMSIKFEIVVFKLFQLGRV